MKLIFLICSIGLASIIHGQQKIDTLTLIEYQIISSSNDQLIINYNGENQQYMGATGQAGWTYVFKTDKKPFTALLLVNRSPSTKIKRPEVTLNILVNGKIVKSITGKVGVSSGPQKVQFVVN